MIHFETMIRKLLCVTTLTVALAIVLAAPAAHAQRFRGGGGGGLGGTFQLGLIGGITTAQQEHMNTLITRSNARAGGISTPSMNSAYEFAAQIGYRFSGSMITLLLRPSFFYQKASGGTSAGSPYNYSLTGFTVFPIFRIYPLENDLMKFFLQLGLGYGRGNGSIEEGTSKVDFVGDAFGTMVGIGSAFCYGSHCATLEGNYRYMTVERNMGTSGAGTGWASDSLSSGQNGREVEMDNTDLATRLGGIQALLGYTYSF